MTSCLDSLEEQSRCPQYGEATLGAKRETSSRQSALMSALQWGYDCKQAVTVAGAGPFLRSDETPWEEASQHSWRRMLREMNRHRGCA